MSKKKKKGGQGRPLTSSDPRHNSGAPSVLSNLNLKKRYDLKVVNQACENEHKRSMTLQKFQNLTSLTVNFS